MSDLNDDEILLGETTGFHWYREVDGFRFFRLELSMSGVRHFAWIGWDGFDVSVDYGGMNETPAVEKQPYDIEFRNCLVNVRRAKKKGKHDG